MSVIVSLGRSLTFKVRQKMVNTRQDLADMGIRAQLHPRSDGKKINLPPTCHTLSRNENMKFCDCLCCVNVPQGYSSNIKSLVQLKDLNLVGLKSHDCHVLMQQLLAVFETFFLTKLDIS